MVEKVGGGDVKNATGYYAGLAIQLVTAKTTTIGLNGSADRRG